MTKLVKIIFLACCAISLSTPMPNHDLAFRERRENPTAQRRASLHELLRKNRNIVSVFQEHSPSSSSSSTSDSGHLPPSVSHNENRRVLVLADGEDMPNYVYDEISDSRDATDDKVTQVTDFDDIGDDRQTAVKPVGDKVTQKYATNFGSAELPSYADPSFLAAVMNQADQANYRYPVENKGGASVVDQSASGSAKIETFSNSKHEINPYEMFPPSFHELLDIPIHIYNNGTTYNPHDKFKNQKSNPSNTRGYQNTNFNDANSYKYIKVSKSNQQPKPKPTTTPKPKPVSNSVSTSQSHLNYFESKKIKTASHYTSVSRYTTPATTPKFTTTTSTTTTTTKPIALSSTSPTERMEMKKIEYESYSGSNLSNDDSENQPLPTYTSENDPRRKPARPSLRFRTKAPATTTRKIEITTPSTKPSFNFAEKTSTTMSPSYPTIRQASPKYPAPTIFNPSQSMGINRPNMMNIHKENKYTQNDKPLNNYKNDIKENYEKIKSFVPPSYEQNIPEIQDTESNYFERDQNKPNFEKNHFTLMKNENEIFFTSNDKARREPILESNKGYVPFSEFPNFKSNFGQNAFINPSKKIGPHEKKPSKTAFKPSRKDPFGENHPAFALFDDLKYNSEKVVIPTTFRPLHSLSRENQFPKATTFRPHYHPYSNKISSQMEPFPSLIHERSDYFNKNTEDKDTQFTNSHSFVKPFKQYSIYNDAQEKQEPQLERGIPVYVSSPINEGTKIIQQEFDRFDRYPSLSIELQPPPNFEFQSNPFEDQYSHEYAPSNRRIQNAWDTNRQSPTIKRRPSFLQKLGLFKPRQVNRSGVSSPLTQLDEPNNFKKKENPIDYVLSNGPAPVNGKKVVVIGPFKEPPFGAPVIYPKNEEQYSDDTSRDQIDHSFEQSGSSSSQSVIRTNAPLRSQEMTNPNPKLLGNFKLPNNNIFDVSESRDIVVQSKFEVGDQNLRNTDEYRQGSVSSVNRFDSSLNKKVPVTPFNEDNNKQKQIPIASKTENESKSSVRSAVHVNPRNYNFFDEVSEEDKNRLIAAKFEIPRVPSVRRSGVQRNIIPIPVPLMSPSGQQVFNFQNIQVPSPVIKKVGRLLDTNFYNTIEKLIHPSSNEVVLPINKPIVENKEVVKRADSISFAKPLRRISSAEEALNKFLNMEQPQSYREPSVSKISFGGWQAVGESPIRSYVKESSPFVIVKALENKIEDRTIISE